MSSDVHRKTGISRRRVLRSLGFTAAAVAAGGLTGGRARAADFVPPAVKTIGDLIVDAEPAWLLEALAAEVENGLPRETLVAALRHVAAREVNPKPWGSRFHSHLVVHSAAFVAPASAAERWMPLFWAADWIKRNQDARGEGRAWVPRELDVPELPLPEAVAAFRRAMDDWKLEDADRAVAALARVAPPAVLFEELIPYGARDLRNAGHKILYVANTFRALAASGWHDREHALRTLVRPLLDETGGDPRASDYVPGKSWRRTKGLTAAPNPTVFASAGGWDPTPALLEVLRGGSSDEAADAVLAETRSAPPETIWAALHLAAAETAMRSPGVTAPHAITVTNALRHAFTAVRAPRLKLRLLLQAAAFIPSVRGGRSRPELRIDTFAPLAAEDAKAAFELMPRSPDDAARRTVGFVGSGGDVGGWLRLATSTLLAKATDAHDFKISAAVFEDQQVIPQPWRGRYLAAASYCLRGLGDEDSEVYGRMRRALPG